jgi:hypothetical protein
MRLDEKHQYLQATAASKNRAKTIRAVFIQ